jgi:hypothetical protein
VSPIKGLIPNIELNNLIKVTESKNLPLLIDDFKLKLDTIQEQSRAFSQDLKMGQHEIKEFCNQTTLKVLNATEMISKALDKQKIDLLRKINVYESDCIKQFDHIKRDNEIYFGNIISDAENFCLKWHGQLNGAGKILDSWRNGLNTAEINLAFNKANEIANKLEIETFDLQKSTFNGKLLTFEKNDSQIGANLIGTITYESILSNDEEQQSQQQQQESPIRPRSPDYPPPSSQSFKRVSTNLSRLIVLNSTRIFNDHEDNNDDEDDDDL